MAGILRKASLASLFLFMSATNARAQGVAFSTSSLPRQMRLEGITETAGEVVFTAINNGTILGGSSIDLTYSTAVTNNSTASTNNISLANNVFCFPSNSCPTSAALVGSNTVRLAFSSDVAFTAGSQMNVTRVRVNANAASGLGSATVFVGASSSNPATNPISFTDPQRLIGVLNPTISVNSNHSSATPNPITQFFTCAFPNDGVNDFFVRVNEVFPGALTTLAQETTYSVSLAPTNGSNITITVTNIPAGLTLSATGTQLSTGLLSTSLLSPDTVAQTVSGTPISFTYLVDSSDTSQVERTTFNFSLKPTTGTSIPDVVSPITLQGTVQITPITTNDSTIVRFVNNQIGPTTLATISNCPPPRPKRPQVISE
jgi:hypothetical protein